MRKTPTVSSLKVALIAVATVSVPLDVQSATSVTLPQAAEFYVGGLEPAYADLFTYASLSEFCRLQFPQECGGKDREGAAIVDSSLRKLKAVTVFEHPPIDQFARSYTTPVQVASAATDLQSSFMSKALEYEKLFLTRYAAVNKVCGGSAAETADLEMLTAVNFRRFWGFDYEGYADAIRQSNEQADSIMQEIRALWSPELCEQARVLGHDLRLILRDMQLKAYMHPGWENFGKREKLGQAATFIGAVTFVFDNKVNPGAIDAASNQSALPPR